MAKQSLATIKNWFRTRLKPTQAQYWDTWDSFWHKDETIPVNAVEDLPTILNSKATNEALTNLANGVSEQLTSVNDQIETVITDVEDLAGNMYEYWNLGDQVPAVGDEFGGGIVFYVADDESYVLVCAPEDIGTTQRWCFNESGVNPFVGIAGLEGLDSWPTSETLQNGAVNTDLIIAALDALGQTGYAAKLCKDYAGGGFTDWYLPTIWELDFMLRNLAGFGVNFHDHPFPAPIADYYWSSSSGNWDEFNNQLHIARKIYNGGNPMAQSYAPDYNYTGSNPFDARFGYVRPIRRIPMSSLKVYNRESIKIAAGTGINISLVDRVLTISLAE